MSTAFQTTIDDLPDQVLGAIIALAGKRNGPSMRRVCKRWDAAVFAEPSFWKEFILAPPRRIKTPAGQQSWLLLKLAQLRRIGAWVRAFKVLDWSILEAEVTSSRSKRPTFTSFLELLDPGLTSLLLGSAEQLTPGAVASLDPFTQLASLSLHTPICVLPPGAAHTLTRLTALQTCSLQALHLTADLVAGLATMRQLSRLDLHFAIAVQPVSLLQLTALDSLSQLNVRLTASRGDLSVPLAVPPPTALPRLTSYSYCAQDGLQMVLSRAVEPGQSGSAALKKCAFVLGAHPSIAGAQAGCLDISHSTCLPSLQALLLELLPAGEPFSYLSLEHCHFTEAAALENCSLLAQLPALLFNSCTLLGGIEDALEALLRQATRLEALSCIGSLTADFGLPQCLTSQSRLKKLLLRQNFLDELPEGEYLKHLEMLDIGGRNFEETELPIQLKLATKLTRLVLNKSSTIKIRRDDITDILMEMSSLQQLDLGSHTVSEFVLDQLEETLPNLKISQV